MASYRIGNGQTSTGIILGYRDQMIVSLGGTANDTLMSSPTGGGNLAVSRGGVANRTKLVSYKGSMFVNGGTANSTVVHPDTSLTVISGTINDTIINGQVYLQQHKSRFGVVRISSGGIANNTVINPYGSMSIDYGGGTANYTTINSGGIFTIMGSATVNYTTVNFGAEFVISRRGITANNTIINAGGEFFVMNSAVASTVTVNSGGTMIVSDRGLVERAAVGSGGSMIVANYGTATSIEAVSGAYLGFVLGSGTLATGTSGGVSFETENGSLSGYEIDNGFVTVLNGCKAEVITVNPGGRLTVSSGGTAVSIAENGGYVWIESDTTPGEDEEEEYEEETGNETTVTFRSNTFSGLILSRTSTTVHSGTTANDVKLTDGTNLYVFSGGIVNQAAVDDRAVMHVSSSGQANAPVVSSGGTLHVSSGGMAADIVENGGFVSLENDAVATFGVNTFSGLSLSNVSATVHSGTTAKDIEVAGEGALHVFSGGQADDTSVQFGGNLLVLSGGQADGNTVHSGGLLQVEYGGATDDIVVQSGGSLLVSSGGTAAGISVAAGAYLGLDIAVNTVINGTSGGTAFTTENGTLLDYTIDSGYLNVFSGGIADRTEVNGGPLGVFSGGTAANTTVASGGSLLIRVGGKAAGATINAGGYLHVESDGTADGIVENGGLIAVDDGANVTFAPYVFSGFLLSSGSATVHSGTTAANTTVSQFGALLVSGGLAADAVVGSYGALHVFSGGTANRTVLHYLGSEYVSAGGSASQTTIESGGRLTVSDRGCALATTINGGGYLLVSSGGLAADTTVNSTGAFYLSGGGSATGVTVHSGGLLVVSSDATALSIQENGGYVSVASGAEATFVSNAIPDLELSGWSASATIHSGTTVHRATLTSEACLCVFSGGSVSEITADSRTYLGLDVTKDTHITGTSGGEAFEIADGKVLDLTLKSGYLNVFNGGTADHILMNGGSLTILQDGLAEHTVMSGGTLYVSSGGTVNNTDITGYGYLYVSSGGAANVTTVAAGGSCHVSSGGTANGVSLQANGRLYVFSDGTADGVSVASGGYCCVSSGGTAMEIVENGGYVESATGANITFAANTISGLTLSYTSATVHSGTTASDVAVAYNGYLRVYSGGTANGTTLKSGYFYVSSGGTASVTTIHSGGRLYVSSGGTVDQTEVHSGGSIYVSSSGMAGETEVHSGGVFYVFSRGTANGVTVHSGGYFYVSSGGMATEVVENGGNVQSAAGASIAFASNTFSGLTLSNASATVHSGTTANDVTMKADGCLHVFSGGTANRAVIQSTGWYGGLFVSAFGTANDTTIGSGGSFHVYSGGRANNTEVDSGGWLIVSSGGTATEVVENGGYVDSATGANITFAANTFTGLELSLTKATVHSGTSANSTTVRENGVLHVFSDGIANHIEVDSGGSLYVSSGGIAAEVIENGGYVNVADGANVTFAAHTFSGLYLSGNITVHSGTTACDLALPVDNYANVYLYDGGKLTGRVIATPGYAVISASEGAIVDFDLTRTRPGARARITDLSVIRGAPTFTITVGEDQAEGVYSLADGAEEFDAAITVVNTDGLALGTLSVGETITVQDTAYTLNFNDTSLSLTIGENGTPSPYTADGLIVSSRSSYVASGEVFFDTVVLPYGELVVSTGGTAEQTTVHSGGTLTLLPGATATGIIASSGARLSISVAPDTLIAGTSGGSAFAIRDGIISDCTRKDCDITISSGGTANGVALMELGSMAVVSGGIAADMTVHSDGRLTVSSGGTADHAVVSGGELSIHSGGTALHVVEDGGYVRAENGAHVVFDANTLSDCVISGTNATVHSATKATGTTILGWGNLYVYAGGEVGDTVISSGGLYVSSGGIANGTTIKDNGSLYIYDGGMVNHTTLNSTGSLTISSGGTANGVTLKDNSSLYVDSGGKLTGQMVFEDVTYASIAYDAIIDFDVSGVTAGTTTARVNRFSSIQGASNITLTVSDAQENGVYLLAGDAAEFSRTISVRDVSGEALGELTAGGSLVLGETSYRLNLEDDNLVLTVRERDHVVPTVSGLQADTTEPTTQPVVITAVFSDNKDELAAALYRIGDNGDWMDYDDGVTMYHNTTVSFKAVDLDGNESETAVYTVANIGGMTGLVLSSGLDVSVLDGETFSDATVSSDGVLRVQSGGVADGATVSSDGSLQVSSGGAADGATVHSGGSILICAGGTATGLIADSGAYLNIQVAPGTYVAGTSGGVAFEVKDGLASDFVVETGRLSVCSGALADHAVLCSGGGIHVMSGGTATDIEAEAGAYLGIDIAPDTYIAGTSGGEAFEFKDGTLSGSTLRSGEWFVVSGVTVEDIRMSGGTLHVSSGGVVDAVEITRGSLLVSSGGTALNVTRNPFDSKAVHVESGAYVTYRDSGVYLGGKKQLWFHEMAISGIWLDSSLVRYGSQYMDEGYHCGDELYVMSGGVVVDVRVGNRVSMFISSGGTALLTEINYGSVHVSSGGTAIGVFVNAYSSGRLLVSSGGMVSNVVIASSGGRVEVLSGGTAIGVAVSSLGQATVSSGGTVNSITISSGGRLNVSSGGKLTGRVICSRGGTISVGSDAIVDFDLTQVSPGAVARFDRLWDAKFTITVNADQKEGVYALADQPGVLDIAITVVNTSDEVLGTLTVGETITISDTSYSLFFIKGTLSLQIGDGSVPSEYTSNGLIVEGGTVTVASGELFGDTRINPGGTLIVVSGGTALETTENGGYADVRTGANVTFTPNMFHGLILENASATVHSGTTAVSTTVLPGGSLRVFSGGTATNVVWTPCEGRIDADEGAFVTFAGAYSGVYYGSGDRLLSNTSAMDFLTLDSAREMYVMSGGNVFSTTVGRGGRLSVASGGTAEEIVWTPCEGQVFLEDGANATFASRYSGVYYGSDDHLLSNASTMESVTLDSGGEMYIMSDAIAHNTVIRDGGLLHVSSGGLANSITISGGGRMRLSSGAYAISPVVSSGGSLFISSGATAVGIILHDVLHVSSAGMAAAVVISSGGRMVVDDGAITYTFISSGGSLAVGKGAAASTFVSSGGSIFVSAGASATEIAVSSGAYAGFAVDQETCLTGSSVEIIPSSSYSSSEIILESRFEIRGGLVSGYGIESGYLDIHSGGTARDITVCSGGSLLLASGGKMTGRLWISGGTVSAAKGAVVDFDLNGMFPWAGARISDLSGIQGTPDFTITVDAAPAEGVYTLANGAADFDRTIAVVNASGQKLGTLSLGKTVTIADVVYRLHLSDDVLCLTVGEDFTAPSSIGNYIYETPTRVIVGFGSVANDVVVANTRPNTSDGLQLSGGIANDAVINFNGILNIVSGGTANGTVVNSQGMLYVSSGGVANRTVANGRIYVYGGGEANDTVIGSDGILLVSGIHFERNLVQSLGAAVRDAVVSSGGNLRVGFGGTVDGALIGSGGALWVSSGATLTNVAVSSGGHLEIILAPDTCVTGTVAGAPMQIANGVASGFAVESAYFYVQRNGKMEDVSLSGEGFIRIYEGGAVNSAAVGPGCSMYVFSGATATDIIENGGYVTIDSRYGARYVTATFASHTFSGVLSSGATATVHSGTTANSVTIAPGCGLILCGGMATNIIENGGYVSGAATFASNTISGLALSSGTTATVHSGTTVNSATIAAWASFFVYSGGKLTGQLTVESGARVHVMSDAILDFDISCLEPDAAARVNQLGRISTCLYTLTVSDRQISGSYALADGAYDFERPITVQNVLGDSLGVLMVDAPLETELYTYTLSMENGGLMLTVDGPDWIAPAVSDIQASTKALTNQNVVLTAEFSDNRKLAGSLYKLGENGDWVDYADGVVVTGNTAVFFKAVDDAGNESEIVRYDVRNIDLELPEITLAGDNVTPLQASTLTASTEVGPDIFYSTDNETWTKYEGEIAVTENGTYYFVATDAAGNVGTAEYVFANIDTAPPVITFTGDNVTPLQSSTLTAEADEDCVILYSTDGETWMEYEGEIAVTANTTYYFMATDAAGNEGTNSITFDNIDITAPIISLTGDNQTPLQKTTLTASTDDGSPIYYRIGENSEWKKYTEVITVSANATYYFKTTDAAGNVGTAEYVFENIDTVPPVLTLSGDNETKLESSTLMAEVNDDSEIFYSLDNVTWARYEGVIPIDANATYYFKAIDAAGNSCTAEYVFANILPKMEVVTQTQTWEAAGQSGEVVEGTQYIVEYSLDNFEHVIQIAVNSNSLDSFQMPAGTYQWRVKSEDADDWSVGQTFVAAAESDTPKVVQSNEDGNDDLFFATPNGTWENIYYAQNVGSVNDWTGTNEIISANGKGRIQNLFFGSSDPNVLCLTDGENGDAIFVDDVYTELPESVAEHTARLYKIQEVRAGAGDDIVDMTSQRFEYIGDGLTIRGGEGNDTIWATKGNNWLYGDAGNDRIVGASGNDVIAGGIGNDRMHGGGGNDVFTFCDNWGMDTVEQLAGGSVTLWFANGDESKWNAETLTYTDGDNTVTVKGVTSVTLKFGGVGEDAAMFATLSEAGAFKEFTSQKIFEENKGLLA